MVIFFLAKNSEVVEKHYHHSVSRFCKFVSKRNFLYFLSIKTLVSSKCSQKPENVHTDVSLFVDIDMKAFCNHLNFWRLPGIIRRKSHLRFKFSTLKSVLLKINGFALFGKCSEFKKCNVCYLIRSIFWTRQKYFPCENIIIIWVNFYPFHRAFCPIF